MTVYAKRGWVGFAPVSDDVNPRYSDMMAKLNGSITTGTTVAVAATATSGNAQTYNMTSNNVLNLFFSEDAGVTYKPTTVTLTGATPAAVTAAEVIALLDADPMFAQFADASLSTTSVKITMRAVGPNGKFYVTGSANTPLGFTCVATGSAAAGTGTVATLPLVITDGAGVAIPYAKVTVTLYQADTAATKDASSTVSRFVYGLAVSGGRTNTAVCEADRNGLLTLEIGDVTGGATTTYAEVTATGSGQIISGRDAGGTARIAVVTGT